MAIRSKRASDAPESNTDARRRQRRMMRRIFAATVLGFAVTGSTGCTMFKGLSQAINKSDCIDEFMIDYRNKAMAAKAWHCQKHMFRCGDQPGFREGFEAGYIEVASGGPGCTPNIAPQAYWGWRYQSAQGQQTVNNWFAGYPMGVKAAEQAGIGHFQEIRSSSAFTPKPVAVFPVDGEAVEGQPNPFYPDGQPVPGEIIQEGPVDLNHGHPTEAEEIVPPIPEAVFSTPVDSQDFTQTNQSNDELVSRFDVAKRVEPGPIETNIADTGAVEMFAPITSDNQETGDELPFTFE